MNEQVLDLKGSAGIVRRFWHVIAALGLAGLLAAAALTFAAPPTYRASALILLPFTTGAATAQPSRAGTTQAAIARSAAVLVPAGRQLHPSPSLSELEHQVTTSSPAKGVLEVIATGETPSRAEALANAVADEFAAFVSTSGTASSADVIAGLRAQATQLTTQVKNVRSQLKAANQRLTNDSTSAARQRDSALVDQLTSQQGTLTLQLNSVKSQIAQAQLQGIAAEQGTKVIQRATTANPPSLTSRLVALLLGALIGVVAGMVGVLLWHRRARRLWSRDALAEAVGAPVLLSLDTRKRRGVRDWTALLEDYRPGALEDWGVRRALRELGIGNGEVRQLRVVVMASDTGGASLAVQVAVGAAGTGTSTELVIAADGDDAAALRAACTRVVDGKPRPGLVLRDPRDARGGASAQLTVTVVVLGREQQTVPTVGSGPATVTALAVSSGFASGEELAAAAIAASDAGTPITCLFVANPIASDHTVGRLAATGGRPEPRTTRRPGGERRLEISGKTIDDRRVGASSKTPGGGT